MAEEPTTIVTKRESTLTTPTTTDEGLTVVPVPWWQIVLIRTARVYLQSLVGFVTANATGFTEAVVGANLELGSFYSKLTMAASLAVAPAALTLLQNLIELLAKLDESNPRLRG